MTADRGSARAEGAWRWFVRTAGRLALFTAAGWCALFAAGAGLAAAFGEGPAFDRVRELYLALPVWAVTALAALLLVSPLRFNRWLPWFAGAALLVPLVPPLLVFGPVPVLLSLLAVQAAFLRWGVVGGRFRMVRARRA
ncbi:hypothetical protein ACIQBJ_07400 [Kitasatospora sp. NPDC088391]|uniref:hypothetical protein n=1 Tax=Kitasatospora sp. NPDC088391 TaxID=3364074 RepID=UPI003830A816